MLAHGKFEIYKLGTGRSRSHAMGHDPSMGVGAVPVGRQTAKIGQ